MSLGGQVVVNFIMLGALYTLIAIGLSLIFSVMNVVNFAHGQMYMLGAYGVYSLYGSLGIPYLPAVILAALCVGIIGLALERAIIRPVVNDQARAMIATLGLLLVIDGLVQAVYGESSKFVKTPYGGVLHVLSTPVATQKLVAAIVAFLGIGALFAGLKWSRVGHAMRALAQDTIGARLQGVRVSRIRGLGFGLGAGMAALAGGLILPLTAADPGSGDTIIVKMFVVLVLGGLGSVAGAVIGAFILAAIETLGLSYFGQYSVLGIYLLVIAILLLRPAGLLGAQYEAR